MNQKSKQQAARSADAPEESPKLYGELASWWPLMSAPGGYAGEAAFFRRVLLETCQPPLQTILELGSGGGNNASHLKVHFQMTLVDRSAEMLAVSRALNPECEHIEGDMRTVRLGRLFDAVFVHDAVMYMTTAEALQQVMETAYSHCRVGGVALFAPDCVRETFAPATDHSGLDGENRAMRCLSWTYDPDESDTTYIVDFAYLLREGKDGVRLAYDRHIFGLFSRGDWLRLLAEVGFRPRVVVDPYKRELFVGVKPGG